MSVDMGQFDAMKSQPRSEEEEAKKRIFAEYKARVERVALAAYIADYIAEEAVRGNVEVDKWMVCDALEAYEGGAR